MLSKYLVSMCFKFEFFFWKTPIYLLFIFTPVLSFTQKSNNLISTDKLFTKWDNSKYQNKKNVLHLSCDIIDTVRIAVIGLGNRGQSALGRLPNIPGVKIVAIADIDSNKVNNLHKKYFKNYQYKKPVKYYGKEDWKVICQRNDIDLIYV